MNESVRNRVVQAIDKEADVLKELSLKIHANPELGMTEHKAAGWLVSFLQERGFEVETGTAGMETAFRALYGEGHPVCAFMCEYDALPEIGHGCGHNLIALTGAGAGLGLKAVIDDLGGTVHVLGTPGEEGDGGKVFMVERGVFDEVDFSVMTHPSVNDQEDVGCNAIRRFVVSFEGKAAHAAGSPDKGINALDAVILTFNGVNALREHLKEPTRIHGIITDGGVMPNIVPEFARADFYLRSDDDDYLEEVVEKFHNVAKGAASMTGAGLTFEERGTAYKARKPCPVLSRLYREEAEALGARFVENPRPGRASSDAGDVSHAVPSIHAYFSMAAEGINCHSSDFAEAAGTQEALDAAIRAAKAMALAAARLISEEGLLEEMKEEFRKRSGQSRD